MASVGVNSVSAVPCTSRVGMRMRSTSAAGPRESNHARSSADSFPVLAPEAKAVWMCGSSAPVWIPAGLTIPSSCEEGRPPA